MTRRQAQATGISQAAPQPGEPGWGTPYAAICGIQVAGPFTLATLPVVAPLLTAAAGVSPQAIGHAASMQAIGSLLFLAFGKPILDRLGPIRAMQAGTLLGALGVALTATAIWPLVLVAALAIGAGYAPVPPASSNILMRIVPPDRRRTLFSIKQATAPLGMVGASLIVPAGLAVSGDWRTGLLAGAVAVAAVGLVLQPFRCRFDAPELARIRVQPRVGLWRTAIVPFRLLARREVRLLAIVGFCFTMVIGSVGAFAVTYLVTRHQMSAATGAGLYAAMQAASVPARVLAGWFADKIGSGRATLALLSLGSCAVLVALALLPAPADRAWLLAILVCAGLFQAGWNGVLISEIASVVAGHEVSDVTASTSAVMFLGYAIGPTLFAAVVATTGDYAWAFAAYGALPLVNIAVLLSLSRRGALERP